MRIYAKDRVCPFRYTAAAWGAFSNFQPLGVPIAAGPWTFFTSEAVYQAAKFGTPRTSSNASPKHRRRGRPPPSGARRVSASTRAGTPSASMSCAGCCDASARPKADEIDAVLAETADRPIVEVSARDPWWGARPVADRYEGRNVLGRLWMELRQQLLEGNPESRSGAWLGRIRVGRLAGGPVVPRAARAAV